MKPVHIDIKKLYNKYQRKWFATYSFFNVYDTVPGGRATRNRNVNAKHMLSDLTLKGYLIRESGKKIEFSSEWLNYPKGLQMKERWRLSGKAFIELSQVLEDFDLEIIDQDYADLALAHLTE